MILNAVLLTLGRIVRDTQPNMDVAILPEFRLRVGYDDNSIQIKNPISGYELSLTGAIDCGVIQYKNEPHSDTKRVYAVTSCHL
jgi:hypothetical protein